MGDPTSPLTTAVASSPAHHTGFATLERVMTGLLRASNTLQQTATRQEVSAPTDEDIKRGEQLRSDMNDLKTACHQADYGVAVAKRDSIGTLLKTRVDSTYHSASSTDQSYKFAHSLVTAFTKLHDQLSALDPSEAKVAYSVCDAESALFELLYGADLRKEELQSTDLETDNQTLRNHVTNMELELAELRAKENSRKPSWLDRFKL